jgi:MerR family transcriptional regulator/heat shock protein HspR
MDEKYSPSDEPVYVMSVAARMVGVHPQTLRLYERVGLIRPCRANNSDHGNRLYSECDIHRLLQIQRFTQQMGVNLAGVEVILDLLQRMEALRAEAEEQMDEMRHEIEQLRRLGDR